MDKTVTQDNQIETREAQLLELWKAYLEAKDRAEQTRDMEDGIAAGKAWAAWVEPFTGHAA